MPKVLSKREKIFLIAAIAIISFGVLFNFVISPVLDKISNLNREVEFNRVKLTKYSSLIKQKDLIQKKYASLPGGMDLSENSKDTLVDALSELESLAKKAGIRIIDIRPQAGKNLDLYKEIFIDLRTEGTMEGYIKFIYNLQNSLSLLKIKRMQLNAKPNTQYLEGSFSISQLSLP